MALSYQWTGGGGVQLVIPGSYIQEIIQPSASVTPSNGVLILMGEASGGPDFSLRN